MFKFNFDIEEQVSENNSGTVEDSVQWYESYEMKISSDIAESVKEIPRSQIIILEYIWGLRIACLSSKEVLVKLKERSGNEKVYNALKADEKHSDLIPGEYEGGLKVWECTKDMVVHFTKNEIREEANSLDKKSVLDLGCGSGILGIMCLLHGASVTFQDYNEEVLENLTIPNIFLNCKDEIRDKVRLYTGDWSSFLNLLSSSTEDKFDYILTSETIYNPHNYKKIIMIIKTLLKPEGVCFVGAKMNYFGVGGSLKEFQALVEGQGMVSNLCWEATEGVARGILKVEFL